MDTYDLVSKHPLLAILRNVPLEKTIDYAEAAVQGAENSRNFVSKFGRAKSYGAKTIGTPDAGAVSMAKFFAGLAK